MRLEAYLGHDDRVVFPVASTEQHAYLSLATDSILAERVAVEAAEPLGVPVLPVLAYGVTPNFVAYPGTASLVSATFVAVVRDVLESLRGQGFRRFLIVNGHGGNSEPGRELAAEQVAQSHKVRWHDWWNGPKVWAVVEEIDPEASHASWLENFPWTRLPGVELPAEPKPMTGYEPGDPKRVREALGDGSFGGRYSRSDEEMLRIWQAGVEEVRELLERGWGDAGPEPAQT